MKGSIKIEVIDKNGELKHSINKNNTVLPTFKEYNDAVARNYKYVNYGTNCRGNIYLGTYGFGGINLFENRIDSLDPMDFNLPILTGSSGISNSDGYWRYSNNTNGDTSTDDNRIIRTWEWAIEEDTNISSVSLKDIEGAAIVGRVAQGADCFNNNDRYFSGSWFVNDVLVSPTSTLEHTTSSPTTRNAKPKYGVYKLGIDKNAMTYVQTESLIAPINSNSITRGANKEILIVGTYTKNETTNVYSITCYNDESVTDLEIFAVDIDNFDSTLFSENKIRIPESKVLYHIPMLGMVNRVGHLIFVGINKDNIYRTYMAVFGDSADGTVDFYRLPYDGTKPVDVSQFSWNSELRLTNLAFGSSGSIYITRYSKTVFGNKIILDAKTGDRRLSIIKLGLNDYDRIDANISPYRSPFSSNVTFGASTSDITYQYYGPLYVYSICRDDIYRDFSIMGLCRCTIDSNLPSRYTLGTLSKYLRPYYPQWLNQTVVNLDSPLTLQAGETLRLEYTLTINE